MANVSSGGPAMSTCQVINQTPAGYALRQIDTARSTLRIGEFRGMRIFLSTPTDYITSKADHWANKLAGGVIGETGPHIVYMTLAFIPNIVSVRALGKKMLFEYPWSPFEDYRIDLIGEKAISSIVLSFNVVGDSLRDFLDPRYRKG